MPTEGPICAPIPRRTRSEGRLDMGMGTLAAHPSRRGPAYAAGPATAGARHRAHLRRCVLGLEMFELEGRAVDAGLADEFDATSRTAAGLGPLVAADHRRVHRTDTDRRSAPALSVRGDEVRELAFNENGAVLFETKGEGGYVIVAPSNGAVHKTGQAWVLHAGGFDTIVTITPDERAALHTVARSFDRRPGAESEPSHASESPTDPTWDTFTRPASEGWLAEVVNDYNARTKWSVVLEGHFEHERDRLGVGYWHAVGAENDIGATTNAKGTDRLTVFSGTAEGRGWKAWDGSKAHTYDRFSTHVHIVTGRDDIDSHVETARRLHDNGYGPPARTAQATTNSDQVDTHKSPFRSRLIYGRAILDLPAPEPIVPGVLYRDTLAVLYGAPKDGKTFVAISLTLTVAAGKRRWLGHDAETAGPVLYIIGEGAHGSSGRVEAWLAQAGYADADIDKITFHNSSVNLTNPAAAAEVAALIAELQPVLVVIDTLARCAPTRKTAPPP